MMTLTMIMENSNESNNRLIYILIQLIQIFVPSLALVDVVIAKGSSSLELCIIFR